MRHRHHIRPLAKGTLLALLMGASMAAYAAPADPMIEGARQCTQHFPQQERANSIPTHLLAAIATTESGRHHEGLGMNVPWPWTINVEGKGYFFASKAEAIANTQNFLAKGYNSIDVGCMQVNLKHHPKAFANLNEAFDPAQNVAYAAKFLRTNYASTGDWIKATAAYHSRTPKYGARYLAKIEKSWNSIVGKVAAARASKAGGGQVPDELANAKPLPVNVVAQKKPVVKTRQVASASVATPTSRPLSRSPLVLRVSDSSQPQAREVLAARPTSMRTRVVTVADATPAVTSPTVVTAPAAPASSTIRRVKLDNSPATGESGGATQYVFTN